MGAMALMRYISLFSGIEAASVAWESLGCEPVAFSEIEPFPCAVLDHHYPTVPNLGDIREIDWSPYCGTVDLIIGGSPCQSFSIAGNRDSLDGESRLMFEYIRAVQEVRPAWIVWENVPGVLSVKDNAFGQLLYEMEKLGYGLAWRVLDAQFFGVAQRRRRVFLVGHLGDMRAAAVLFESDSVSGNTKSSREKRSEIAGAAKTCAGFKINAGAKAGNIGYQLEQSPTLITDSEHIGVIALQSDGTTSQNGNGSGYQTDGTAYTLNSVDRQCVCMANDAANSAIDENLAGTLINGGGRADNCITC